MNSPPRFNIVHIDLSAESAILPPDIENEGSYTVLWWKEIPLGHFVLEPQERVSENHYRDKIATAILPAIRSYESKIVGGCSVENGDPVPLTDNLAAVKASLETILAPLLVNDVRDSVPISVIICTHNRPTLLHSCLSQLCQSSPRPQEIIVVDNAPDDCSTRDVVNQFANVRYIIEPKRGLDFARNRGIMESSTAIVVFTDDDMEVHPLWPYRVWETFQDESIAAMTGLVFASCLDIESEVLFERYWSFNRGYVHKIYDREYFSASLPKGPPVWEIGGGGNMAIRRTVFDEVGYFHELLGAGAAGGSDDSEMLFRILAKGKNVQYNPRAVAYHKHRKNISELNKQIFSYMRGFTAALLWQNRQRPDAGYKWNIFVMLVRYAIMCVKGFPGYKARSQTVWVEIKGVIAGIAYFYNKENRSLFSVKE